MRWWFQGLAIALVAYAWPCLAHAEPLRLPSRAATREAFVPKGFALEATYEGDLDADGTHDAVLVLLQDERGDADRERALVVLLQRPNTYVLAGSNRGFLTCYACGGAKGGDGAPDIKLQRGVLLVEQLSGSREFTLALQRFRWSPARKRMELIGEDTTSADAATGRSTETSCNLLTRECVETVTPEQVDDEGRDTNAPSRVRSWKVPKRALEPLERIERPT